MLSRAALVFGPTVVRSSKTEDAGLELSLNSSVSLLDFMVQNCLLLFGEDALAAEAAKVRTPLRVAWPDCPRSLSPMRAAATAARRS